MMSTTLAMGRAAQAVIQGAPDSTFSLGTLLMFVGGAILLAFFCSIGVIARIRERKIEQRNLARRAAVTARDAGESG